MQPNERASAAGEVVPEATPSARIIDARDHLSYVDSGLELMRNAASNLDKVERDAFLFGLMKTQEVLAMADAELAAASDALSAGEASK
ncbi:hypothetical protein [Albidovulum sp.]|uniref:hypothetical protein n=1 Tax=Albidovulum sp. TaxID=1872424 RepID=UPI0039B93A04